MTFYLLLPLYEVSVSQEFDNLQKSNQTDSYEMWDLTQRILFFLLVPQDLSREAEKIKQIFRILQLIGEQVNL